MLRDSDRHIDLDVERERRLLALRDRERQRLKERMDLLRAYQEAMVRAADGKAQTFMQAIDIVSPEMQAGLRKAFEDQVNALMGR